MAEIHLGSFEASDINRVFEWSGPSENNDLATWATYAYRDASIDDSGPVTYFQWQLYDWNHNPSSSGQFELTGGCLVTLRLDGVGFPDTPKYLAAIPAGSWRSDEYGRPFSLNDLLA